MTTNTPKPYSGRLVNGRNDMQPSVEEARLDLTNIRSELEAMRRIKADCDWLSRRDDVDSGYYFSVSRKQDGDIAKGERLEQRILSLYPELL